MTEVPLGRGAYTRLYAGAPEIKLVNRWLEASPSNLREGTTVLSRPGTTILTDALDPGTFVGFGPMRGNYALNGLFNDTAFIVCGSFLYRLNLDMTSELITGTISGTGHPEVAYQKGAGYERLWISDGLLLQFYGGTTGASGTLTKTGTIINGTDVFEIGAVYYTWGTSFSGSDAGTVSNPYVVNPTTVASVYDPMNQLVLAVMNAGVPGVDYSGTITGPHPLVIATSDAVPATVVTFGSILTGPVGNTYTLTIATGTALAVSGTGHLINGGINALQGCPMPDGQTPGSITQVSSYVLVAVAGTQKFYWIKPGETTIDPLNFASKESSPDPIEHMRTVGDQVMIIGSKSTENWYATGNLSAPFAPIQGRVYARGCIPGTPVVIDEAVVMVGDDGRVYSIGLQGADATDAGFGVARISNNGIEERIRYQIRQEMGLSQ